SVVETRGNVLTAGTLVMNTNGSLGSVQNPFATAVGTLSIVSPTGSIDVANTGAVTLTNLQANAASQSITVSSSCTITVGAVSSTGAVTLTASGTGSA